MITSSWKRSYTLGVPSRLLVRSRAVLMSFCSVPNCPSYVASVHWRSKVLCRRTTRSTSTFESSFSLRNNGLSARITATRAKQHVRRPLIATVSAASRAKDGKSEASIRRSRVYGGPSVEFLAVSGILATIMAIALVIPASFGVTDFLLLRSRTVRICSVALMSFSYALMLSQFDLKNIRRLRLTIAFVLGTRFVLIPALSHFVAILGYALAKAVTTNKTTAAAAAAAVAAAKTSATAKATAKSLSLPSAVLSSLFLLSTTPVGYSPSAATLSSYIYPTLLAYLTLLTLILFPILPSISHAMNRIAHKSSLLNVAGTLPLVAPPPPVPLLVLTTTFPALAALALVRVLPSRASSALTFAAMPLAWTCSAVLLASAVRALVSGGGITGLAGSIGLCGGVVSMMGLAGRVLGAALLLDERAKRTLILYLCTQGAVIGAGLAPVQFASAPPVAAAIIGLLFTMLFAKRWSKVVIRTSKDIH